MNTDLQLQVTILEEKLERLTDELLTVYRTNDELRATIRGLEAYKGKDERPSRGVDFSALRTLWESAPEKARRRSSRKQVVDAWKATKEKPDQYDMLQALESWKQCEDWRKSNGDFVQGLHLWIKNRQWENVPDIKQDEVISDTREIIERVNSLKSEWQMPATWSTSEVRLLASTVVQMKELSEQDWLTLNRFLNTSHSNAKAYWIPHSRSKFIETFSDVFAGCQRWAEKKGIKFEKKTSNKEGLLPWEM